jgi:hypothetical protein
MTRHPQVTVLGNGIVPGHLGYREEIAAPMDHLMPA